MISSEEDCVNSWKGTRVGLVSPSVGTQLAGLFRDIDALQTE